MRDNKKGEADKCDIREIREGKDRSGKACRLNDCIHYCRS